MAIFKQSTSENWWISIYRGAGQPRKYIPAGTSDRAKAEALEALAKSAMNGNMAREKLFSAIDALMGWDHVKGVAVDQLWAVYLKTKPTIGSHTLNQRRKLCEAFTVWLAERYPSTRELHEITPQQAYAFSDWLVEDRGGKGKTHNNRIGNLKTVFQAVVVRANMQNNPFNFVQKLSQADSVSGRAFTKTEQEIIFKQCAVAGNDWLAVCMLARYSGLRLIDIAALKWDQVRDGALDVTPSKTRKHGICVRIPIHPKVDKELEKITRISDYVFATLAGRYMENDRNESGFMEEILNIVGIDREGAHISFHCWRHTFRTELAAANVPQEVAMKLGGWTNESTAEIYNHDFTQLQTAINSLR